MKKHLFFLMLMALFMPALAVTTHQIDGNTYTVDTLQHFKVGPGAFYTAIKFKGPALTFRTFYLELDNNQNNFEIRSELGRDSIIGCENISDHALRKSNENETYFAAVNGDFFETSGEVGTPVNGSMHNGIMGTMVTGSPHYVVAGASTPYASYINHSYSLTIGKETTALSGVNSKMGDNNIVLYTPTIGKFTHTPAGTTEVQLALAEGETWKTNAPMKFVVKSPASTTGNRFTDGMAVLSASGTKAGTVAALNVGDEIIVKVTYALSTFGNETPDIRQMVGGNVIFLQNGVNVPTGDAARHPRTMVGYNKDRSKTILAVVDGRSSISSGCTYDELSGLMIWANADWAINIDGGGSSSLFFPKFGAVNDPSDGKERAVGNGIYCVSKTPADNTITELRFIEWAMAFPKYGIYTPKFYGYNQYGVLVDTDVQGVTLSCDPKIGEIINDGTTFYGTGNGCAALTGTWNGITATIPVTVEESDRVRIRLENVLIDNAREYDVEVRSFVAETEMAISPTALTWTSADPEVASIGETTGLLKGIKNGTTTVSGRVGAFSGDLNVTVELPTADVMPVFRNFPTGAPVKQVGGEGIAMTEFENGFKLNYTGKSGRGQYIEIESNYQIWSLPEKLKIRINPGEAMITKITANGKNALGEVESVWVATDAAVPNNQLSEYEFNLTDWCDPTDIAIYPIILQKLRFTVASTTVGKAYEIAVPGFEAVYNYKQGGVERLNDNALRIFPNVVNAGEVVNVFTNGIVTLSVYSLGGSKIAEQQIDSFGTLNTESLSPGLYVVKVAGTTSATAKMIIK